MKRRAFLAIAGGAALAGCNSAGSEPIETPSQTPAETPTPTESTTAEPTPTPTETTEADVRIQSSELQVSEGRFSTERFVVATVVNEGEGPSGPVTLSADWHNSNGDFLDSSSETLISLGPGETWLARVHYAGSQGDQVDDYELGGEFERRRPSVPEDVELQDTRINIQQEDIQITGRVSNDTGSELAYLEAHGELYDESDRVLQSFFTNQTNIPAGETWAFEIQFLQRDRLHLVTNYDVMLSGRF